VAESWPQIQAKKNDFRAIDTNWHKFKRFLADVFQVYPNAYPFLKSSQIVPIHASFWLSAFLLANILSRYCDIYYYISVNSMSS